MAKVNCPWSACKWNTAEYIGEYGVCTKGEITLVQDIQCDECGHDMEDVVDCEDFSRGGKQLSYRPKDI